MRKIKSRAVDYYESLSYQGKFRLIFNFLFVGILVLVGVITLVYSNMLSDEIYEKHQEKLTYLSQRIENEFNSIESLITEIHQSTAIQASLLTTNSENIISKEYASAQSDGAKEMTWLLADKINITRALLLNNQNRNLTSSIYDPNNFFDGFSLEEILDKLPQDSKQGKWFFKKDLSQGLFIQNIFNTKWMTLDRIGILVVFVNTNFIQTAIEEVDYFRDEDFYFLEYEGHYLSSVEEDYFSNLTTIQDRVSKEQHQQFHFATTANRKYFLYPRLIRTNTSEFTIYYFLLNNQVIKKVIQMMLVFMGILLLFMGGGYILTHRYLRKLLDPINLLVIAMQRFKGESDLQNLRQLADLSKRKDEIGLLYGSFQRLISEIQDLVIKDYQAKLLASEMEYRFLQAQLDPHFLYNTLNSINWLAINKGDWEISEMVTALSKLLRKKLDNTREFVTIQEELELIQAYIKIQSVRYDERLVYKEEIAKDLIRAQIPQLIIQPLIENAIKYAVERLDRPVTILLEVRREGEKLIITVTDDGPGFDIDSTNRKESTGLGIINIKNRLKMLYGNQSSFLVDSTLNVKTKITIELPFKIM